MPSALGEPTLHLHLYGKSMSPGRKVGHVTVLAHDAESALATARAAAAAVLAP